MERKFVKLDGKEYAVVIRPSGCEIYVQWERIVPSTALLARPSYNTATRYISPCGRLGKKILKAAGVEYLCL